MKKLIFALCIFFFSSVFAQVVDSTKDYKPLTGTSKRWFQLSSRSDYLLWDYRRERFSVVPNTIYRNILPIDTAEVIVSRVFGSGDTTQTMRGYYKLKGTFDFSFLNDVDTTKHGIIVLPKRLNTSKIGSLAILPVTIGDSTWNRLVIIRANGIKDTIPYFSDIAASGGAAGGWTLSGTTPAKIYSNFGKKIHVRGAAGDTTETDLFNVYGSSTFKGIPTFQNDSLRINNLYYDFPSTRFVGSILYDSLGNGNLVWRHSPMFLDKNNTITGLNTFTNTNTFNGNLKFSSSGSFSLPIAASTTKGDAWYQEDGTYTVGEIRGYNVNGAFSLIRDNATYSNPAWVASLSENKISFTDITTNNASTTKHGYLPKLNNVATDFLNGQGNWASVTASSSTNLAGGSAYYIPYQSSPGVTTFLAPSGISSALTYTSGGGLGWLTYTNLNTVSTLVWRDAFGNFSAGTITAALSGNASTATSATTATNLAGGAAYYIPYQSSPNTTTFLAPSGTSSALTYTSGGSGLSWLGYTNANTVSTLVWRDGSGNFSAGTVTAALNGNASTATSATTATNLAGGANNRLAYQTGSGSTGFIAAPTGLSQVLNFTSGLGTIGWLDYTNANTASTLVWRNASGDFSAGTITASLSGNASTVTNGVYTNGSYSNPAWITALAETKISFTDVTTGNASTSNHGFLPKLNNSATQFLNGKGSWATPTATIDQTASYSWTGIHKWTSALLTADTTGAYFNSYTATSGADIKGLTSYVYTSSNPTANKIYGGFFSALGSGTSGGTKSYGIYSVATGSNDNYAGYFNAPSGYAGYFDNGLVYIKDNLQVGSAKFIVSTTGTLLKINDLLASDYTNRFIMSDGTSYTPTDLFGRNNTWTGSFSTTPDNMTFSGTMDMANKKFVSAGGSGAATTTTLSNGIDGQEIILMNTSSSFNWTLNETGNINLAGTADYVMGQYDTITLVYYNSASKWIETSRSDN